MNNKKSWMTSRGRGRGRARRIRQSIKKLEKLKETNCSNISTIIYYYYRTRCTETKGETNSNSSIAECQIYLFML